MKKIVIRVVVAILAVLLIGVIAFGLFAGAIIKKSVNTVGPAALGVPVTLQDARFSPLRGHLRLSGLHVGNPVNHWIS